MLLAISNNHHLHADSEERFLGARMQDVSACINLNRDSLNFPLFYNYGSAKYKR